jgi:hypothetical protein
MLTEHPRVVMVFGFFLVLFGVAVPWLMVTGAVPTSFVLCFLSYGASVVGMMLGLISAALKAETKPA